MKYLQKVASLPQELEANVLYLNSTDGSVALKPTPKEDPNYVDLGLPSGLKWAKCNVGATSETGYGLLFQWGDTVGYDDASHSTWETAPFNGGDSSYNADAFAAVSGTACPNGVLAAQYDAAYQATNGVAHMPTQTDFNELTANTTVTWVNNFNGSGINGRKFTASNGNYIFIPASGYAYRGSVDDRGSYGNVWSSSLYAGYPNRAWYLLFSSSRMGVNDSDRYVGYSVRGVVSK